MPIATKADRRPLQVRQAQPDHRTILARRLATLADCELQHGHVAAAEHLARRAAELRSAA